MRNLIQSFIASAMFAALGLLPAVSEAACSRVTPAFIYSKSRSCGIPVTFTFTNTSTGVAQNVSTYTWKVNGVTFKTVNGKAGATYVVTNGGTYTFRLVVKDTTGCSDSVSTTVVISSTTSEIKDYLGNWTFSPTWVNCISNSLSPDTFGVFLEPRDTLKDYKIVWGDGNSNSGTALAKNAKLYHKYLNLGKFNVAIITNKTNCPDTIFGTVFNERQPVAGLTGPPTGTNQGCTPLKVRFINASSNISPATNFTWTMGDGSTIVWPSTKFKDTLFHTYRKSVCSGNVMLVAANFCGSSSATWNPIKASSKDSAIIKHSNPTNCDITKDFLFDNNSEDRYCLIPNTKWYKWDWGDGTSSGWTTSKAQQTKKYSSKGNYTVRLIDSNFCGKDTELYNLVIGDPPVANATVNQVSGCAPFTPQFLDKSTGTVTSRTWSFNDPYASSGQNFSSATNPTHTYTYPGTYKAILQVNNNCGPTYDTIVITVYMRARPSFVLSSTGCIPVTIKFTNTTGETTSKQYSYKWFFGDGTSSTQKNPPDKTYSTAGTYQIMMVSYDTCGNDTFKQTLNVYGKPTANFTPPTLGRCEGNTFNIANTSSNGATIFYWNFGDGSSTVYQNNVFSVIKKFDSAKTYNVRLIAENIYGCRDTITKSITINPNPVAGFNISKTAGCAPMLTNFTNTSQHKGVGTINNMNFFWYFGNGQRGYSKDTSMAFAANPKKDTVYSIKLVGFNSYGCKDSITKSVSVYPNPTAAFSMSPTAGCAPLLVKTTNTSRPNDTGSIAIMSFRWKLRAGLTSNARDTSFYLSASKTKDTVHSVELVAISEHGCLDSTVRTVTVYPKPKADFTPDVYSGCKPLKVNFTNNSIPNDTGSIAIMKFKWMFNWRDTSVARDGQFIYNETFNKDTSYDVGLVGISEHGCRDTIFRKVTLHPDAKSAFYPDFAQGCGPLKVTFTNTSLNGAKYSWYVDGVKTDTTQNFIHWFQSRDIFDSVYNVQLASTSPYGCKSDTTNQIITVKGDPVASYISNKDTFCFPDKIQFFNQSLNAYKYRWNLGDGTLTNSPNPSHFFVKNSDPSRDTTYYISLEATSAGGCRDTVYGIMVVLPYPVPKFKVDVDKGCAPLSVSFTNQSANTRDFFWYFGDGFTAKGTNATHTYYNGGPRDTVYRAILFTYSLDCVDSESILIPVYKPTEAYYKYDRIDPCDAGWFSFKNESVNGSSYLWNYKDGTTSNGFEPNHLFPTSPYRDTSYNVTLTSISNRGCRDSFSRNITLPQRLNVKIKDTSYRLCIPGEVQFKNFTKGAVTYVWDFGDGGGSAAYSPVYQYLRPGIFKYKLVAYDPNGCKDSMASSGNIQVAASPEARIDFTPPKGKMPNSTISFLNKSISSLPLTYMWNFNDPGNQTTSNKPDPYHTFSDSG